MTGEIRIETDHPVTIVTTRPVSMKTEGVRVTLTIGALRREPSGLVRLPQAPGPEDPAVLPESGAGQVPRCGRIMSRSGKPCARPLNHKGICAHADTLANKKSYNAKHNRERYNNDPEYAERVKAAVRAAAHAQTSGEAAPE